MWRGYHKFAPERFEELAGFPATEPRPTASPAGALRVIEGGESRFCCVWDGLVPEELCAEILAIADKRGYERALLNQGDDRQEVGELNETVRRGQRCIIESEDLARRLWVLLEPLIPPREVVPGKRYSTWKACGVNPTLRLLRYDAPSDHFELHQDGSYSTTTPAGDKQRSFLTLQLYLNNGGGCDFAGGATRMFLSTGAETVVEDVVPRTGRVLLFQHNIWHIGEAVQSGTKLVLRSEVMYSEST